MASVADRVSCHWGNPKRLASSPAAQIESSKVSDAAQNELGSLYGNGHGVEKDYVEAYRWFELAASRNPGNDFETRENAARNRDTLATRMTPAEIAEAQKRAKAWKPQ